MKWIRNILFWSKIKVKNTSAKLKKKKLHWRNWTKRQTIYDEREARTINPSNNVSFFSISVFFIHSFSLSFFVVRTCDMRENAIWTQIICEIVCNMLQSAVAVCCFHHSFNWRGASRIGHIKFHFQFCVCVCLLLFLILLWNANVIQKTHMRRKKKHREEDGCEVAILNASSWIYFIKDLFYRWSKHMLTHDRLWK